VTLLAEVKNAWSFTSTSSIHLHGFILKKKESYNEGEMKKFSPELNKQHTMKTCETAEISLHAFLNSTLEGGGQLHAVAALTPDKEPAVFY
jgi:hypothetical protein